MVFRLYHCIECGDFEITHQSMHDKILDECPKCGARVYQKYNGVSFRWLGRFRWMKGNPEVDMDKIEAEQNREQAKKADGKITEGLKEKGWV